MVYCFEFKVTAYNTFFFIT